MLTEQHIRKFGFVPLEQCLENYPDLTLYRHPAGTYVAKDAEHYLYYVRDDNKLVSLDDVELRICKNMLATLTERANCLDEIKYICERFCKEKSRGRLGLWLKTTDAINPHPYQIPPLIVKLIITNL